MYIRMYIFRYFLCTSYINTFPADAEEPQLKIAKNDHHEGEAKDQLLYLYVY
jgi:hypothetical protein